MILIIVLVLLVHSVNATFFDFKLVNELTHEPVEAQYDTDYYLFLKL